MISMIRKPTALAAALLAIGLLGTSARADLVITVQEDSGSTQTFTVSGTPSSNLTLSPGTVTTTDYTITGLGGQAQQYVGGGYYIAIGNSSATTIKNTTGSTGHVLHITITGSGFTNPIAPPTVLTDSQISGSVTKASSTNTLAFQSYVNGVGFGTQNASIATAAPTAMT